MAAVSIKPVSHWLRKGLCAVCVASAVGIQYWLTHVPVARALQPEIKTKLGQRLVLLNPRSTGKLFELASQPYQTVDLVFQSLRLGAQFERILRAQGKVPAASYAKGGWVTTSKASGEKTYVEVGIQDSRRPPARLTIFQYDKFDGASFAVRATGGELALRAYNPFDLTCAKDCRSERLLWLESPALRVNGNFHIHVVLRDGGEMLVKVTAPAAISAAADARTEIEFAAETSSAGPAHLLVDGIAVVEDDGAHERVVSLACAASNGAMAWLAHRGDPSMCKPHPHAPQLKLTTLKVGRSELTLEAAGSAWQWNDGTPVSEDWLVYLTRNPLLGIVLATLNTALLEWTRREWLSRRNNRRVRENQASRRRDSATQLAGK